MRILFLSDLHFSNQDVEEVVADKWNEIEKAVIRETEKAAIEKVVVTGDICSHGKTKEFEAAEYYLSRLLKKMKLKEKDIFFCRGNHDADKEYAGSTFFKYTYFLHNMYQHTKRDFKETAQRTKSGLLLMSINTCARTSLEEFDHAVLEEDEVTMAVDTPKETCNILLMHHQPGVIENQTELRRLVQPYDLILSGHLHGMDVSIEQIYGTTSINGLAVTPHLQEIPSGFQILEILPGGEIQVVCYKRKKGKKYKKQLG